MHIGIEYKGMCLGVGGVRVDHAVAGQILEAVSGHAMEAALRALQQVAHAAADVRKSSEKELEQARYEASLAARRHAAVDPDKRLVARELEARWNAALSGVAEIESRIAQIAAAATARPPVDRAALLALAHDLPAAWNAPSTNERKKQRLTRILIQEVVIDQKDDAKEVVVTIHWTGGCHTELRVSRISTGLTIAQRTVAKYMFPRLRRPPSQNWKTFLRNHLSSRVQVKPVGENSEEHGSSMQFVKMAVWEFSQHFCDYPCKTRDEAKTPTEFPCTLSSMVSVDFLIVPTLNFHLLYVFIVLSHHRRRVLHFNVAAAPSAAWTAQQLREAFPFTSPPKYLLRDRDSIYGLLFQRRAEALPQDLSVAGSVRAEYARLWSVLHAP